MSKQVNITVYRYEELQDKAKVRARNLITQQLLNYEEYWMSDSLNDFEVNIFEDEEYRYDQLPDNMCYQWDFNDYLGKYEGTKSGKWLIAEFKRYLNDVWYKLDFEEKDIIDYATENDLWFFKEGSLFNED